MDELRPIVGSVRTHRRLNHSLSFLRAHPLSKWTRAALFPGHVGLQPQNMAISTVLNSRLLGMLLLVVPRVPLLLPLSTTVSIQLSPKTGCRATYRGQSCARRMHCAPSLAHHLPLLFRLLSLCLLRHHHELMSAYHGVYAHACKRHDA